MIGLLNVTEAIQHAVLNQVAEGRLGVEEAAERLGLHRSSVWRKLKRLGAKGPAGLAHRLRGRPSNYQYAAATREAVLALYRAKYAPYGFRIAHFYERAH